MTLKRRLTALEKPQGLSGPEYILVDHAGAVVEGTIIEMPTPTGALGRARLSNGDVLPVIWDLYPDRVGEPPEGVYLRMRQGPGYNIAKCIMDGYYFTTQEP